MIELHTFRAAFGQPTGTPFGVKAAILLRMADLPHKIVYVDDPRKAPKGKMPLIVDGGQVIADSTFIRHHLEQTHGADFDAGLTAEQEGVSLAFQRLAEEHLYWSIVAARWLIDDNWAQLRDIFFGPIPKLIRPIIAGQIRKKMIRDMHGHGMGRHSLDEQMQFGIQNLAAIADWLGDKPFMHGDTPTAVDASVGAFVGNIHGDSFDSPLRDAAQNNKALGDYAARIKALYYPDGT
jgi:glutathione S-transferase